jgi:type I restriction enzyme S subunit
MTRASDLAVQSYPHEGDLPEGWAETKLEDLVLHALGGEWGMDEKKAVTIPGTVRVSVLRGLEFRDWSRERATTASARWVRGASLDKRRLQAGDIVVEISGGGTDQPVGRTVLIDDKALESAANPLICSNFCRQIRIHSGVDPRYVELALRYQYYSGGFDEYQTQTTNIRNLNFGAFLGATVPLPPLAEQQRIAERVGELLERAEKVREGILRVPGILRRLRQSALAAATSGMLTEEWRSIAERELGLPPALALLDRVLAERREDFEREGLLPVPARKQGGRPARRPASLERSECQAPAPLELPEAPASWTLVPLQDVILRAQYGTSVKATGGKARGGVPILRMGNIQNGRIDTSDMKYVDPHVRGLDGFLLRRGDILFNRTNSPELVGKAAVFQGEARTLFASYLVRLGCDERLVASPYVCAWINSPWGRWWARAVRTDCVSQSNINASKLLAMPMPLPSLEEQVEIVRRLDDIFRFADAVEVRVGLALERAQMLDRMILAKALRGELVMNEAELADFEGRAYETAADLLDRIRADRRHALGERGLRTRLRRQGQAAAEEGPRASVVPARGGVTLENFTLEQILAFFRQSCWGAKPMPEDKLLREVADRLRIQRLGPKLRRGLEEHLKTAVARRIVALVDGGYISATPKFGRYDYDFLMTTLRVLMRKNTKFEPEVVVRLVAAYLGFSTVTPAMRERMKGVFQSALRLGLLATEDGLIWRRL